VEHGRGGVLALVCARIGAIQLVEFAGFGAGALGQRLRLSGATAAFCADTGARSCVLRRITPMKFCKPDALGSHWSTSRVMQGRCVERGDVADGRAQG
jgi:hypothetical protein